MILIVVIIYTTPGLNWSIKSLQIMSFLNVSQMYEGDEAILPYNFVLIFYYKIQDGWENKIQIYTSLNKWLGR